MNQTNPTATQEDDRACPVCGTPLTADNDPCYICGRTHCFDCSGECPFCHSTVCRKDARTCAVCGQEGCSHDFASCTVCGKTLCPYCQYYDEADAARCPEDQED